MGILKWEKEIKKMLDFIMEEFINFICYLIENPKAFFGACLMGLSLSILFATLLIWN